MVVYRSVELLVDLMNKCRLCLEDRKLSESHIVPEFLYANLYNNNHKMLGITGTGKKGFRKEQKGLREKLLCADCESFINLNFEIPFKVSWVDNSQLPEIWKNKEEIINVKVDYSDFKLFHLSVLFRASISRLPTFSEVNLGPHEEKIRKMLLNKDPGSASIYPIHGYAIIHHETSEIIHAVTKFIKSKFNGCRAYGAIYSGVHWWIGVSSHIDKEFVSLSLNTQGYIPIHSRKMNEVSLFQEASTALKKK